MSLLVRRARMKFHVHHKDCIALEVARTAIHIIAPVVQRKKRRPRIRNPIICHRARTWVKPSGLHVNGLSIIP